MTGFILIASLLARPAGLHAQPAALAAGQGFFVSAGAGWGSLGQSDCPQYPRIGGLSGYLDIGTSISERVRLGLLTTAWMKREDPSTTAAAGNASGAITLFPLSRGRLYARLGLGLAIYSIDGGVDTGFGFMAGTGYEFRPTRSLGAGPYLNWYHGDFDRFSTSVLQVGFAIVAL